MNAGRSPQALPPMAGAPVPSGPPAIASAAIRGADAILHPGARIGTAADTPAATAEGAKGAPAAEAGAPATGFAEVLRLWTAVAALSLALVQLAVLAANLTWWPPAGVGLGILAGAELCWSAAMFRARRTVAPRVAGTATVASVGGWLALHLGAAPLTPAELRLPTFADVAALILHVAILGLLVAAWRREARAPDVGRPAKPLPAPLLLALVFAGTLAFSAVTTAGLAATDAGTYAQPHGSHSHSH